MARRKFRGTLPDGLDAVVDACEVRAGMWLLDPETGEWGNVKQAGRANVCVGFGGVRTWRVSLRKLGEREFAVNEPVTVRIAAPPCPRPRPTMPIPNLTNRPRRTPRGRQ